MNTPIKVLIVRCRGCGVTTAAHVIQAGFETDLGELIVNHFEDNAEFIVTDRATLGPKCTCVAAISPAPGGTTAP